MQASVRDPFEASVDTADWVAAAESLCRAISKADSHDPSLVVERVLQLADADLVTLVTPATAGTVTVVAAAGTESRQWHGTTVASDGTLAGSVLRSGQPKILYDVAEYLGDTAGPLSDVDSLLAIPLHGTTSVRAVLTIGRRSDKPAFTDTDLALASLFVGQLAQALNHREESQRLERLALVGERDRIALGMQSQVITPLFALGMRLQGAAGQASGSAAAQLAAGSDDIDEMIKAIRATVYRLAD